MRLLALGLLAILGSGLFSQSADSRFEIFLRKSDNSPQTGSTVSIKNLGTMTDYALSEVVGSPGLYRRDDVPVGMYAVYVNSVLKTTNRFHPTNQIALTLAQIDPDKNYMIDTQGLETGAVTTDKILDSTIMKIDLDTSLTTWIINNAGGGGGGSGYQPDGVTIVFTLPDSTLSVANLGITTGKLAADAVTSAKIQDGTVTTSDIANSTISTIDLGFTLTGDGLVFDELNNLNVQGDGSTIGVISDQVQILANAIDSSHVINHSIDTTDLKWNYFNLTPGNGLTGQERIRLGTSNIWDVNPDNTTITISGDAVAVKDAGIYPEKVNALVAGLGLGKPSAESGIQINAGDGLFIENDTLKVNASGVINAGLGLSQDGNDFNVNTKEGIVISADTVQLNPSIGGIGLSYDAGVLNVKAGHGVQISSDTVRINPAIAGKGLKWKGDSLDINVTDKSLIISSDTLKVNSAIAGAGLGYAAEALRAQVNRGLAIASDTIGIADGGIQWQYLNSAAKDSIGMAINDTLEAMNLNPEWVILVATNFPNDPPFFNNLEDAISYAQTLSPVYPDTLAIVKYFTGIDTTGVNYDSLLIEEGIWVISDWKIYTEALDRQTFISLTDVPSSYENAGGSYLRVSNDEDSIEFVSLDSLSTIVRPYKIYVALLTQSGTNDPTAIVLENTIGNIVWEREEQGKFTGTLAGAFPDSSTACFSRTSGNLYDEAFAGMVVSRYNDDIIGVSRWRVDFEAQEFVSEDGFVGVSIEIRVYQ